MKDVFTQPEYLHLLLGPVLTHALPIAALALGTAMLARSRAATRLALALVAVTAAAVWPTVHYGRAGYDRVQSLVYHTGVEWLEVHRYRAEHLAWTFYLTAGLAVIALLAPGRWPKMRSRLAWLTLAAALGSSFCAAYIAWPGGKVRHSELRQGPPPAAEVQAAHREFKDNSN